MGRGVPNIAETGVGEVVKTVGLVKPHRPLPKYHNWLNKNVKNVTPPTTVKIARFDNDALVWFLRGGGAKIAIGFAGTN